MYLLPERVGYVLFSPVRIYPGETAVYLEKCMNIMKQVARVARETQPVIVFPEGEDPSIQQAAERLACEQLIKPVLLGDIPTIENSLSKLPDDALPIKTIDLNSSPLLDQFIETYCQERDMSEAVGRRIVSHPLNFGAMMVKSNAAQGMVAGIAHPTEEVIMASELLIGLEEGVSLASSFFLMEIPDFNGGENGLVIFADPAVNPNPDPSQLADIAVCTARSAQDLFAWQPRLAMLSFSTHGSADHPLVNKVVEATMLARQKAPDILIEGEIQADAALVEAVALKKIGSDSKVAGKANILIFPDLNAANIGSKLVQRLAGAASYGPILQGFAKPVSDLSRGATVEDIVGAALMVAAKCG